MPERSKTNTTAEGRKPQLSALLSEVSAVSANEWCKTADNTGMRTVSEWKRSTKLILLQTQLKKADNSQGEKLKLT